MRNRHKQSMDGFVPRSGARRVGDASDAQPLRRIDDTATPRPLGTPHEEVQGASARIRTSDVDSSLQAIDKEYHQPEPKRRFWRRKKSATAVPTRRQKLKKRLIIGIVVLLLLAGAFLGLKTLLAGMSIFDGNLLGILQNKPLKTDANGRTNVLVFGTSGSIKDTRHEGANLTDTLMVLSIDQKKKDAYMISLPRDLYVDYGQVCPEGYQGKINSMYSCYEAQGGEKAGARALQKKVTSVTGLTMQYYAHINWAVVVGAINAVGGVTVNVDGHGSCAAYGLPDGSVYDVNMNIKYTPGPHKMSGTEALKFSRARGSAGGCGLDAGDYDRQANQQKVLKALKAKAVSAETLTNLGKVTSLIDTLGANLSTDFETSEVRTLMSLGNDIPSDKIKSISLVSEKDELITGDMINGASVQIPTAGMYEYSEIKAYINKKVNASELTREAAKLGVYNATSTTGYAQEQANELTAKGYTVRVVGNAPSQEGFVTIYALTEKKPATKKKLESFYDTTVRTDTPPVSPGVKLDFILIYGKTTQ